VAVSKELHRALDIREQHGDLLPLTFEDCPGGEDLIGKMLGRVTLGRGKAGIVPNGTYGMATLGQNLAVDVTWLPQLSQARASGAAHSSQNFALSVFSCRHFGHFIVGPKGRSEPAALRG